MTRSTHGPEHALIAAHAKSLHDPWFLRDDGSTSTRQGLHNRLYLNFDNPILETAELTVHLIEGLAVFRCSYPLSESYTFLESALHNFEFRDDIFGVWLKITRRDTYPIQSPYSSQPHLYPQDRTRGQSHAQGLYSGSMAAFE